MAPETDIRRVHASIDSTLSARIVRRVSLVYDEGADATLDRPAYVRAASGVAWVGDTLAVIQDDANFVALINPITGSVRSLALPAGNGGLRQFDDIRGNKADKCDFESLASFVRSGTTTLIALGSGSSNRRESIAIIDNATGNEPLVRVLPVPGFYARLRARRAFSGSELNVEGIAVVGNVLRLFNRGNGAVVSGQQPVNATCDVSLRELLTYAEQCADNAGSAEFPSRAPCPEISNVMQYELGDIDGTALTFTDAALLNSEVGDGTRLVFVAAAESSPDATRDGPVTGSVFGVIETQGARCVARYGVIHDTDGSPCRAKVEGVAHGDVSAGQYFIVIDTDDCERPSELCELRVRGV